ncbi:MAG: CheR family methyltransferase [Myxococcaceae bacterium]
MTEDLLQAVADLLGHRLSETNRPTLEQALSTVGLALGVDPERAAVWACQRHPVAYRELVSSVTVNETYFFRHPEHFDFLTKRAMDAAATGRPYRFAWSVGCATGEEAYSIATVLSSYVPDPKIAGTDISQEALEVARLGRYGSWSFRERPAEKILGMRQVGRQWEVSARHRLMVSFHEQNFADDPLIPPMALPQRVDVIFCRNVLLYLKPARAAAVRRWLCEALADDGILMLGALEGPEQAPAGFDMRMESNACVIRRVANRQSMVTTPPMMPRLVPQRSGAEQRAQSARARVVERSLEDARSFADRGDFDGALRRIQPFHEEPDALFLSATIHGERGELARAEVLLRQVLLLRPHYIPAYLHLALITTRSGDMAGLAHYRSSLLGLLGDMKDEDDVGLGGMKVAYVRQVLAGLPT